MSELFDIILDSPTGELEEPSEEPKFPTPAPASTIVAEGIINGFGKWSLDENGLLTINGKGKMPDWDYSDSPVPWKNLRNHVRSIHIADGITRIGNHAFRECNELTTLHIPNSVTDVGNSAFSLCTNLIHVTIPHGVTYIGSFAFSCCSSLKHITIPESVTTLEAYTFYDCTSLTSVTIPHSITTIKCEAFSGCTSLSCVTIPNSVTYIEHRAFAGCTSLTDISVPDNITVGFGAFDGCDEKFREKFICTQGTVPGFGKWTLHENGLLNIVGQGKMPDWEPDGSGQAPWTDYKTNIRSVSISDGITSIGSYSFHNDDYWKCKYLTTVHLPNSVTCIGKYAFGFCRKLAQINIPSGVTVIEDCAFWGCNELVHVNLPNTITVIEGSAFRQCCSLTSITIPNSVRSLGCYVFDECYSLRSVTMPQRFDRLLFKLEYGIPKRIVTFT